MKHIPAWAPGAGFRKVAMKSADIAHQMSQVPFNLVKKRMVNAFLSLLTCIYTTNADLNVLPRMIILLNPVCLRICLNTLEEAKMRSER